MADIYKIMKRLEKGVDVEANLSAFSNHMMSSGNRLSYSRFALNYPTFYETYKEIKENGENIPDSVEHAIEEFNHIVKKYVGTAFSGQLLEESIAQIDALRKQNIKAMQLLTAYTDCYTIYEYVLNRMEYRFKENNAVYSEEEFKTEILNYLTMDHDNSMRQMKTIQVLGQLPMRMTKGKFFQILQDSFSVYIGSEKESIKDLLYMIRMAAMMEEPDGMKAAYPSLYQVLSKMAQVDFKTLTEEEYVQLADDLKATSESLNRNIDLYMALEELTNDLYVILLSTPYAIVDLEERENCQAIIQEVLALFEKQEQLPEQLFARFEKLEGVQERCADLFHSGESMLEEVHSSYESILEGAMLDKIYCSLGRMSQLLSTSLYVELDDSDTEHSEADREYIMQLYGAFSLELKEHLKKQSKPVVRAIMAKIITLLPVFVRTYQELESYIELSLSSCTDPAEKAACVEIIKQMMAQSSL